MKPGAKPVTCTVLKSEETTVAKSTTQKAVVHYEKCTAGGFAATISAAHYNFNINGKVTIEEPIVIESSLAKCKITVPAQEVGTVEYNNKEEGTGHGKIEVVSKVTGIHATVKGGGGLCGKENVELKEGTYTGNALVTAEKGEVKVK